MGQIVVQNTAAQLLIAIVDTNDFPALGLDPATLGCQFRRDGESTFTPKALTGANFTEIGNGYYTIAFDATELSTVGAFIYVVTGAGLQQASGDAQIVSFTSTIPTTPVALPTCRVTGSISSLGGAPVAGASISVRVLGMPTIEGFVGVTDDMQTATTDADGVFFIDLVQLAVVEAFIPRINYRRQFTVPATDTVSLFGGIA